MTRLLPYCVIGVLAALYLLDRLIQAAEATEAVRCDTGDAWIDEWQDRWIRSAGA